MTYEHHKEALLTTLKEITVELASLPGSDEPDLNDVADNAEEWEERAATLALLETTWNDTRRALAKMDAGTYGVCEICQAPIAEDRLEANPSARTCLAHIDEEATLSL
jgi:DnaK suppressor protein